MRARKLYATSARVHALAILSVHPLCRYKAAAELGKVQVALRVFVEISTNSRQLVTSRVPFEV